MTLPRGTWFGELTLFEVYANHNGPRLFSVVDALGKYYLAVSTDEDDDHEIWLYVPISETLLAGLRAGDIDLADPFRKPEGGFAFSVTTFNDGKRPSKIDPIHYAKLTEDLLPRAGFKLKLTEPPPLWRLNAIRNAETSETSAHETRVVRPDDEGLTAPAFVAIVIRRWGALLAALVPKIDIHVASLSPGSLRTVFAVPKAKQKQALDAYSALVACGTDIDKLRDGLNSQQLIIAYYELVRLLSEAECSLELATVKRGTNKVDIHELPRALAQAQLAGLSKPSEESKKLPPFVASVMAASLSAQTIELRLKNNELLSGTVVVGGTKLTGLRIGAWYEFSITRVKKTDSPKGDPKIELHIHSAVEPDKLEKQVPLNQSPLVKHKKAIEWSKLLAATDAQHAPSGSIKSYVPLTKSNHPIDAAKWFRHELFGDLTWSKGETEGLELSTGEFRVKFMKVWHGVQRFDLSHDPGRLRYHNDPPTRLHWNELLKPFLKENDMTKQPFILRRDETGQLFLIIGAEA